MLAAHSAAACPGFKQRRSRSSISTLGSSYKYSSSLPSSAMLRRFATGMGRTWVPDAAPRTGADEDEAYEEDDTGDDRFRSSPGLRHRGRRRRQQRRRTLGEIAGGNGTRTTNNGNEEDTGLGRLLGEWLPRIRAVRNRNNAVAKRKEKKGSGGTPANGVGGNYLQHLRQPSQQQRTEGNGDKSDDADGSSSEQQQQQQQQQQPKKRTSSPRSFRSGKGGGGSRGGQTSESGCASVGPFLTVLMGRPDLLLRPRHG